VCGERRSSLGIVTPYIAQLNLLSQQLAGLAAAAAANAAAANAPTRASSSTQQQQQQGADEAAAAAAADVLEIKTVDGYQGREKEVVLFSAVRANAQAQVGYSKRYISRVLYRMLLLYHMPAVQCRQGQCTGTGGLLQS
jgi:superfamily I DNA and/or RNA helicase